MIEQEKEYKRVMDLIMRKDMWKGHYLVCESVTGTKTYLSITGALDTEIRMVLGGLDYLHIKDIIAIWGKENVDEKISGVSQIFGRSHVW
jgi:hypothetical protein